MKILMVNSTYGGVSGSGRAVKLLSKELLKRGLKIDLLTGRTLGSLRVPKLRSLSFALLARLKEKKNYDVIHVHNPKLSMAVGGRSNNVLTVHGDFLSELQRLYGQKMATILNGWFGLERRKFRAITCVSPYWSRVRGWTYVPNGLDLDTIAAIAPSRERSILFVGRKDKIKGHDIFEQAVKKTKYQYRMFGVNETVSWEEVIARMKSAYCLVLPSEHEGMPYVILEAFACGCPVVATDLPTLRSFGEGAIHFLEKRDARSVEEAIEEVTGDQGLWQTLRSEGLEKAKQYDIRNVADQYMSIYKQTRVDG
jgi:glycosyltransferase involved in cell wall biosynthesis